jgi:ureidoglycolate lyase
VLHRTLVPEPLTQAAFAPYGDLIQACDSNRIIPINYGLTERHDDLCRPDIADHGGHATISVFKSQPITLPFRILVMERHPLGSQAFAMLSGNPYIVVVAPPGSFDHTQLRAFAAKPYQGVNIHKGTWHHYCLGLNAVSDFLVIDRGGEGDNCDEQQLPSDVHIELTT